MNKTSFATGLSLVLGGMACASDFTWSFPDAAVAPKAEICTFLYGKTWDYSFEMDDNPAGAFTIAKPLFDACTATDAPPGVPGGNLRHLPGTLAIIACALDNGNATNISLEQLKTVLADGWSVANHGYWSTGIHWDKALANDEGMYRREFFWGQFFISRYLWDGKRACTGMVFPNGDPGYIPFLREYGFLLGTRYADSPHNVLSAGGADATGKVNWLDCGRLMLDSGHWQSQGGLDPLWLLPKEVREGDWLIDFTHGISEEGKGNHEAAARRLEYIRKTWGSDGADNVWFAPSDRVAEYRMAAEAATVAATRDSVTVSLPDTVYAAPLTIRLRGIDPGAELTAPEGGLVYRDAEGAVYLTTPVIGSCVNPHPAGGLFLAHSADLKVAAGGEPQEIAFEKPVKLAGVRLRQMGGLPEGFELALRFVTPDGREVPFHEDKYAKWVKLGNAWGNWRLFPLLPDEEPLLVSAIRYNAVPSFNRVEVWAVE